MSDDHALNVLRGVLTRLRSQPGERDHWDAAASAPPGKTPSPDTG